MLGVRAVQAVPIRGRESPSESGGLEDLSLASAAYDDPSSSHSFHEQSRTSAFSFASFVLTARARTTKEGRDVADLRRPVARDV